MKKYKKIGIGIVLMFAIYGMVATAQNIVRDEGYYMESMLSKSDDLVAQYTRDRDEAQSRLDNEQKYNKNIRCSLMQWKLNNEKSVSDETKKICNGYEPQPF